MLGHQETKQLTKEFLNDQAMCSLYRNPVDKLHVTPTIICYCTGRGDTYAMDSFITDYFAYNASTNLDRLRYVNASMNNWVELEWSCIAISIYSIGACMSVSVCTCVCMYICGDTAVCVVLVYMLLRFWRLTKKIQCFFIKFWRAAKP